MTSSVILSSETNTFNSSNWIQFERAFFQLQDETLDFVSCAEKCFEKHATLPCVESPEMDRWLFEQYNDNPFWIGLYQSPGTSNSKKNWINWQREGCDSTHRNWASSFPNDFFGLQQACVIIGWKAYGKWVDSTCNWKKPSCICQYEENLTENTSFFEDDASLLREQSGKTTVSWDYILTLILSVIAASTAFFLLLHNIKLLKKLRGTKDFVSKRTLKLVRLALLISILVPCSDIIHQTTKQDLPSTIHTLLSLFNFLLLLINIFLGFIVSLSIIFNLLDAAALATGGVKETKKSWIRFLRVFSIIVSFLTLLFAFHMILILVGVIKVAGFDEERRATAFCLAFSMPCLVLSFCGLVVYLKIRKLQQKTIMNRREYMLRMSVNKENTNQMHRGYEEVKKLSIIVGIILFIMGVGFIAFAFTLAIMLGQYIYLILRIILLCNLLIYYVILRYTANNIKLLRKKDQNHKEKRRFKLTGTSNSNGEVIYDANGKNIGRAPPAPLPDIFDFTPSIGQANVELIKWSISLENLLKFLRLCMATETWKVLVTIKGKDNITMHDINTHFVIPWTKGSGCSIALLFDQSPEEVELMISHSWSASVIQTFNALNSLPLMHMVPVETRVFFCTLCQYQPGDNASQGLSIKKQLEMEPFSRIIKNEPKFGMFIIHTLISEVYTRLWCVFEVNEGLQAGIEMTGLFDPNVWTLSAFEKRMKVNTEEAECHKNDRKTLVDKIEGQGGFHRLDKTIFHFRKEAFHDLSSALKMEFLLGVQVGETEDDIEEDNNSNFSDFMIRCESA